jgi:signal transduction histidine kinase
MPINIQVVASILQRDGYQLAFARDGKTAINMALKIRYDLILLDIMMPEMDGFEVCTILKQDPRTQDIPIIFLTAKVDMESVVKGFELGGVDYVAKPFNGTELLARVKTHIKLKHALEDLARANNNLVEINATKDKIFSIIGHDLRGPIGSLRTLLEIVTFNVKKIEDRNLNYFLKLGKDSVESILRLLENLLSWAKSQQGEMVYNPEFYNIQALIEENIYLFKNNVENKNINLYTTSENAGIGYFDKNLFNTIFRNLISNAIKFTPKEGTIVIESSVKNGMIEIAIKDSGVGISQENISRLFDKKYHLTTFGTNNEGGTGLGLMLCKEFVERNGGTIKVESEIGKGSVFSFTVPANQKK